MSEKYICVISPTDSDLYPQEGHYKCLFCGYTSETWLILKDEDGRENDYVKLEIEAHINFAHPMGDK